MTTSEQIGNQRVGGSTLMGVTPSPRGLLLTGIGAYTATIFLLAWANGMSFNAVELNPAAHQRWLWPAYALAISLGYLIAYILPGLALVDARPTAGVTVARGMILSILAQSLILTAFKWIFNATLTRSWFVASCIVLWGASRTIRRRKPFAWDRAARGDLASAAVLAMMLVVLFAQKIFVENFAGDGTEHFEYARSLTTHLLPYWDLENGFWGFHPRFMFFAYPSLLSVLSVGEIEASVRLPGILFSAATLLLILEFVPAGVDNRWWIRFSTCVGLFLMFSVNAHYSTWDPFVSDIAEPLTTDLITMYFVLASLYFVTTGHRQWFLACALPASVSTQFGAVLLGLGLGVFWLFSRHRRHVLVFAGLYAAGYSALMALAAWYNTFYPHGDTIYQASWLLQYWSVLPNSAGVALQLLFLVLMSGGVTIVAAAAVRVADPLSRNLYCAALGYATILALSPRINPHYFLPSTVLIMAGWARRISLSSRAAQWSIMSGLVAAVILLAVTPPAGAPFDNPSRLAATIRIDAPGYAGQVGLATLIPDAFPRYQYGVGRHTLTYYVRRSPCTDCDYVLTSDAVPVPGYDVMFARGGATLYAKPNTVVPMQVVVSGSRCADGLRRLYTAYRRRVEGSLPLRGPTRLPWAICLAR